MNQRAKPRVLICCNADVREHYIGGPSLERLAALAEWEWLESEGQARRSGVWGGPSEDAGEVRRLRNAVEAVDALVVCHGSPYVDGAVMAAASRLTLVGELEGDRFGNRIDVEEALRRGIRVVDTTHGSSLPVAEWALGLMLIGLRNAAQLYRDLIAGRGFEGRRDDPSFRVGELTDKTVGIIGYGHIGRRLTELLRPFRCRVLVYDPYLAKDVAVAMGVQPTTLERVMADPDVVVCCAPLTPGTRRMLGARELDWLRQDAVFVNVSRGAIVDSDALIERAGRCDIRVCLDVFDPEPIPTDSPIRRLPNVFLSPHIAGVTLASRRRFFDFMVDELERHFAGHETLFDLTPRVLANRRGAPPAG